MSSSTSRLVWIASISLSVIGSAVWYDSLHRAVTRVSSLASTVQPKSPIFRDSLVRSRTIEETKKTAEAQPCDKTVLTYLDLSRIPTQGELIAAGNLGEPLTPTSAAEPAVIKDPVKRARQEQENLAFGTAIQTWNQHHYPESYALFEKYIKDFPSSPWAAEAQLHLGCFCQYNGRMLEAAESFDHILSTVELNSEMYHKA